MKKLVTEPDLGANIFGAELSLPRMDVSGEQVRGRFSMGLEKNLSHLRDRWIGGMVPPVARYQGARVPGFLGGHDRRQHHVRPAFQFREPA